MSSNVTQRFTAVVNPAARSGRLAGDVQAISRAFSKAGLDVQMKQTEGPRHAVELACKAAQGGHTVIAAGGDGTVNEVARGVLESGTSQSMAVLPLGSGNDFARMIGMSNDMGTAIEQIKTGIMRRVDVGNVRYEANETTLNAVFVNAAGIGFDGHVATIAPRYKGYPFGSGYLISILVSLLTWKSVNAVVEDLSDPSVSEINDRIFFMTVGNARDSGGGYSINPRASIVDGKLDICLVSAVSRLKALRMLPATRSGGHLNRKEVRYWHTERIRFVPDRPIPLHTDGEVQSHVVESLEISIQPRALCTIVPESRLAAL